MIVYPAIDIMDGQCVRLTRGDFKRKRKYSDDPLEVAYLWKKKGAGWIHIIDLDGARTGRVSNHQIASEIRKKTGVKVQYGGGIRDSQTVEKVLDSGIDRVILGTRAIEDGDFLRTSFKRFGARLIISLDFGKDGTIYKNGWKDRTSKNIFVFIKELEVLGMKEVIVTDIERDGTLAGIDQKRLRNILDTTSMNFIIAGGISNIDDIRRLKNMEESGISGVIAGKALYEGTDPLDLELAIRIGKGIDN